MGLISLSGAGAAEPARWGASLSTTLFETCEPFFCRGLMVAGEPANQSFERRLRSEATAPFGASMMGVELVLSGRINLPRFYGRVYSAGPQIHWCEAKGTVVEGYRFTGPTKTTVQFAVNVHASTTATNTWDGIKMEVYLCRAPQFQYSTDLGWLLFESGVEIPARQVISVLASDGDQKKTGTLEMTVSPGERFYLVTRCQISIFQVDGASQLLSPAEVTCLTPEGLVSVSEEDDVPLTVARAPGGLRVAWGPTRRPVQLERSSAVDAGGWLPVADSPSSTVTGSSIHSVPGGEAAYFRLKVD